MDPCSLSSKYYCYFHFRDEETGAQKRTFRSISESQVENELTCFPPGLETWPWLTCSLLPHNSQTQGSSGGSSSSSQGTSSAELEESWPESHPGQGCTVVEQCWHQGCVGKSLGTALTAALRVVMAVNHRIFSGNYFSTSPKGEACP